MERLEEAARIYRQLSGLHAEHRTAMVAEDWIKGTKLQAEIADLVKQQRTILKRPA